MSLNAGIVSIIRSVFSEEPKRFTITSGVRTYTTEKLFEALEGIDIEYDPWAYEICESEEFCVSRAVVQYELVRITGEDLGLRERGKVTRAEVYAQAHSCGYDLCPPEAGPLIWLQYPDMFRKGDCYALGMDPILNKNGNPGILCTQYMHDERGLFGAHGEAKYLWDSTQYWIFRIAPKMQ